MNIVASLFSNIDRRFCRAQISGERIQTCKMYDSLTPAVSDLRTIPILDFETMSLMLKTKHVRLFDSIKHRKARITWKAMASTF